MKRTGHTAGRRKLNRRAVLMGGAGALVSMAGGCTMRSHADRADTAGLTELPKPETKGEFAVQAALARRRSMRDFASGALTTAELGQLLWAAQGVTSPDGKRAAPSAGALYPLEVYAAAGKVDGLEAGVYRYQPESHALQQTGTRDVRQELAAAALHQDWVADAPVVLVLAAVYVRTTGKYGDRGIRYVHIEIGHAAQNVYLQAEALDLATVMVGAFRDDRVAEVLGLPSDHEPLAILPVGRPA